MAPHFRGVFRPHMGIQMESLVETQSTRLAEECLRFLHVLLSRYVTLHVNLQRLFREPSIVTNITSELGDGLIVDRGILVRFGFA